MIKQYFLFLLLATGEHNQSQCSSGAGNEIILEETFSQKHSLANTDQQIIELISLLEGEYLTEVSII